MMCCGRRFILDIYRVPCMWERFNKSNGFPHCLLSLSRFSDTFSDYKIVLPHCDSKRWTIYNNLKTLCCIVVYCFSEMKLLSSDIRYKNIASSHFHDYHIPCKIHFMIDILPKEKIENKFWISFVSIFLFFSFLFYISQFSTSRIQNRQSELGMQ